MLVFKSNYSRYIQITQNAILSTNNEQIKSRIMQVSNDIKVCKKWQIL